MGKSTINHSFKSYVCLPEGNKYVPEYMPDTVPDNIPLECQLLEVTRFINKSVKFSFTFDFVISTV
jgi:hypothetical protein